MLRSFRGVAPRIALSAYIDPGAVVIGDVAVGERSSVWPLVSLRGDLAAIHIGEETNIQDGAIVHTDEGFPALIGNRVTVGHAAIVHGCVIEDESVIGIGAIVLTGAKVGRGAVVAAGALVTEGMEVPADTLVMGSPAKPRRTVRPEEHDRFRKGVRNYADRSQIYLKETESENA
jgi:carbonic anhydrase/acetyltransferase-like protein (isoleucine patch superfamily)